jgi:hypothetical protein
MKGGRNHFGKRDGTPEEGKNAGNSNLHGARWDQAFNPKPKYVGKIRTRMIDDFKAKLLKRQGQKRGSTLSPASANKHVRHLKAALRKAHRWEHLAKLPDFVFLDEPEKMPVYMHPNHFDAIYIACDHATVPEDRPFSPASWWKGVMVTGIMSGMRIMEMMDLRWVDVA